MVSTDNTLTIECCAKTLKDVLDWLDKKHPSCRGEILKHNCQDNTVSMLVNFPDKMSWVEFKLTFL